MAVRYKFVRPPTSSIVGRGIDMLERVEQSSIAAGLSTATIGTVLSNSQGISSNAAPLVAATGLLDLAESYPEFEIEPVFSSPSVVRSPLTETEDNRIFSPHPNKFPTRYRWGSRLAAAKAAKAWYLPYGVTLENKDAVLMCIRRKNRRGALLALGQGGGFHRPPRRSPTSDIWC